MVGSTNVVTRSSCGRQLTKEYGKKKMGLKGVKYALLRLLGRSVPVEYRSPQERLLFEGECLRQWRSRGFAAPELYTLRSPYLTMEYVDGCTLEQLLRDPATSLERKLEVLEQVFLEMRQRHCWAIYECRHELIHYDSNTRNILISNERVVHIDFEMGHLEEKIDRSAAREVKKLTLEAVEQIGVAHQEAVIDLLVSAYGIRHVLRRAADEELERSFMAWHRRRDRRRKKGFSKLDLAESLKERGLTAKNKGAKAEDALGAAVSSSWDGKFYQSFDDQDPRGRDMQHRYLVMQFPEDLRNKRILDIGCNLGRVCMDAMDRGANSAIGVDYREDVIEAVNDYCQSVNNGARFYAVDVNAGAKALQKYVGTEPFDIVCALSIWSHVDQEKLWEIIDSFCGDTCLFEDNAPSRVGSVEKLEGILRKALPFKKVEFLGFTYDRGIRSVFRLRR